AQIACADGVSLVNLDGLVEAMATYRSTHGAFDPTFATGLPDNAQLRQALAKASYAPTSQKGLVGVDTAGNVTATFLTATGPSGALQVAGRISIGSVDAGSVVVGAADVNFDGVSDVIFKNANGYFLWRSGPAGYTRDDVGLAG